MISACFFGAKNAVSTSSGRCNCNSSLVLRAEHTPCRFKWLFPRPTVLAPKPAPITISSLRFGAKMSRVSRRGVKRHHARVEHKKRKKFVFAFATLHNRIAIVAHSCDALAFWRHTPETKARDQQRSFVRISHGGVIPHRDFETRMCSKQQFERCMSSLFYNNNRRQVHSPQLFVFFIGLPALISPNVHCRTLFVRRRSPIRLAAHLSL